MRSQSTKWCLQRILSGYSNLIEQFFQLCFGLANTRCWTWLCLLNILISCNISYNPLTTLVMCRTCMYVKYLKREMWKRKRNPYCYKWQIWKPKRFTCFRLNRGLWHSLGVNSLKLRYGGRLEHRRCYTKSRFLLSHRGDVRTETETGELLINTAETVKQQNQKCGFKCKKTYRRILRINERPNQRQTMGLNVDRSLFFFFATTLLHKTESLKKNLIFFPNRKPSTKLNKSIFCVFTDERKDWKTFSFSKKKSLITVTWSVPLVIVNKSEEFDDWGLLSSLLKYGRQRNWRRGGKKSDLDQSI